MMFVALRVMGRAGNMVKLTEYLFTYMGAPLVNLDNFIAGNDIGLFRGCAEANGTSALFGAQTFRGLYNYAGKIFNIEKFGYDWFKRKLIIKQQHKIALEKPSYICMQTTDMFATQHIYNLLLPEFNFYYKGQNPFKLHNFDDLF